MEVDFSKINVISIDGDSSPLDVRKQLGNYLYYQSRDLTGTELGKRIYFAEAKIEISDDEAKIVKDAVGVLWQSYVVKQAFVEVLEK